MTDLRDWKKNREKIPSFHTKVKVHEHEDSNMLCCNPAEVIEVHVRVAVPAEWLTCELCAWQNVSVLHQWHEIRQRKSQHCFKHAVVLPVFEQPVFDDIPVFFPPSKEVVWLLQHQRKKKQAREFFSLILFTAVSSLTSSLFFWLMQLSDKFPTSWLNPKSPPPSTSS